MYPHTLRIQDFLSFPLSQRILGPLPEKTILLILDKLTISCFSRLYPLKKKRETNQLL